MSDHNALLQVCFLERYSQYLCLYISYMQLECQDESKPDVSGCPEIWPKWLKEETIENQSESVVAAAPQTAISRH